MVVLTKPANAVFAGYTDGGAARAIEPAEAQVWGTEMEVGQRIVEQNSQLANSPLLYGGKGDGTTDDSAAYAAAEVANDNIFLPSGAVFNLGSARPAKPVFGTGAMKLGGHELSGFNVNFMPDRDNIVVAPTNAAQSLVGNVYPPLAENASTNNYMNAVFSPGSIVGRDGTVAIRSTVFGTYNGQKALHWTMVEAFGHDALSFAEYVERSTALGSETFVWAGITSRQKAIDYKHDLFRQGILPNEVGWDAFFSAPAGTGMRIWNYASYATSTADFSSNVAAGRNAGNNIVKGVLNTFDGVQAAAGLWDGSENTVTGALAANLSYFFNKMAVFGARAVPRLNNDVERGSIFGYRGLEAAGAASRAVAVGAYVGGDTTTNADDAVLIGYLAGQDEPADLSNKLIINNVRSNTRKPLISGDFPTGKVGFNVSPADILGYLHSRVSAVSGATVSVSAAGLVLERNADHGMTILTGPANFGQILFGDNAANNSGALQYDHSTDTMQIRAGGQTRFRVTNAGVGFNGAAVSAPQGYGAPTGTATRTTFATGSVTLPQLAERVKALIDDLRAVGLAA